MPGNVAICTRHIKLCVLGFLLLLLLSVSRFQLKESFMFRIVRVLPHNLCFYCPEMGRMSDKIGVVAVVVRRTEVVSLLYLLLQKRGW